MPLLENWVLLAIIAGLASNMFHFFSRVILKGKDTAIQFAWFLEVVRVIIFSILAITDWKIIITSQSIILFALLGITELLAAYCFMKMHVYTHLSVSTIVSRSRLIWVPIFGLFLLQEKLSLTTYIGIAILFLGLTVAVAPRKLFFDKGVLYANCYAILVALNIVFVKMSLSYGSNSVINLLMVLPAMFIFPLLMKDAKKEIALVFKKGVGIKFLATLINIVSLFIFTAALKIGDASKVTGIYQGMMITAILAGIFLLKETKDIKRKLLGTSITLIAVLILSLT